MAAGRVMPIFRRQRETVQQIQLRLLHDFGAQADLRFQMFIVHTQLSMQLPRDQLVFDCLLYTSRCV